MTKRTVANLVAGVVLASSGVVAGLANPAAAADDSGWNGTRIGTTSDSGWNGTKLVKDSKAKKDGKIKKAVKKGDDVTLVGFGTFTKSKRKARTGRNPQTGKEIKIPAMTVPKFRAGREFKLFVK